MVEVDPQRPSPNVGQGALESAGAETWEWTVEECITMAVRCNTVNESDRNMLCPYKLHHMHQQPDVQSKPPHLDLPPVPLPSSAISSD